MKVGKRVVLAVSLAISMSAFADDQTMGSGGRDGGNTMGSGNGVTAAGGMIGSGTLTSEDDGGILGSGGGKEEGGGGTLGSGTRVAADDGGGTIGSGTLTSEDDGGLVGSGGGKEEERGGMLGSGTRSGIMGSGGYFGSGLAIITDAFGVEYLVISDGVSMLVQPLN